MPTARASGSLPLSGHLVPLRRANAWPSDISCRLASAPAGAGWARWLPTLAAARRLRSPAVRRTLPLVVAVLALAACAHDGRALRPPGAGQSQSIVTTSTSTTTAAAIGDASGATTTAARVAGRFALGLPWADAGTIAAAYTCKGGGIAPLVTWAEVPAGAKEIALTVTDDTASGFVHWVVAGLDPKAGELDVAALPTTAVQSLNGANTKGWNAPCPPVGSSHRYRFTIYALSAPSGLADGADNRTALAAVQRNVLALDVVFGIVAA